MKTIEEIHNLFTQLTNWTGDELLGIDFILSSYLATYFPGSFDPPWGLLRGAPGSGKSEIFRSVHGMKTRTIGRGNFTLSSFSSGFRDANNPKDVSMLGQLTYDAKVQVQDPKDPKAIVEYPTQWRKVLSIPDMTKLINSSDQALCNLFGDMRTAFQEDEFQQQSGNVGLQAWRGLSFGCIMACTDAIDDFLRADQTLGQRMVMFTLCRDSHLYSARKAVAQWTGRMDRNLKKVLRERILNAVTELVEEVAPAMEAGELTAPPTQAYRDKVSKGLCTLATSIRTVPRRNSFTHHPESPTRLTNQLLAMGEARAILYGRDSWTDNDLHFLTRVAQDSCPVENLKLLRAVYRGSPENAVQAASASTFTRAAKVGKGAAYQLRQWSIIGVLDRLKEDRYRMCQDFAKDLAENSFMEQF